MRTEGHTAAHDGEPSPRARPGVEADPGERERFGGCLEAAGLDVMACPGPTQPDYTCVGARDGACPLVSDADLVVLDMSLDSEAVMLGTPAEELLGLYLVAGRPVVVLGSRRGEEIPGQLLRLHRRPDAATLLDASHTLLRRTRTNGPTTTRF